MHHLDIVVQPILELDLLFRGHGGHGGLKTNMTAMLNCFSALNEGALLNLVYLSNSMSKRSLNWAGLLSRMPSIEQQTA